MEVMVEKMQCTAQQNCSIVPKLLNYFGYAFGIWSRMAEIGVRTTFIVLTSIASLLFDQLAEETEQMAEKLATSNEQVQTEISIELEDWKNKYHLVSRFVEQINQCFGLFLLIITGHDFATAIFDFANILQHLDLKKALQNIDHHQKMFDTIHKSVDIITNHEDSLTDSTIHMKSDPIKTFQFVHPIFRFLVILVISHSVGSKVCEF